MSSQIRQKLLSLKALKKMLSKLALTVLVVSTFGSVAAVPGKIEVKNNCKEGSKSTTCQLEASFFSADVGEGGVAEIEVQLKPDGPSQTIQHVPGASKGIWYGQGGNISCNFLESDATNKDGEVMLYGSIIDEAESMVYQITPDADGFNEIHVTATSDFDDEMDAVVPEPFADEVEEDDWWLTRSLEDSVAEQNDDHADHRHLAEDGSVLDVLVPWTDLAECLHSGLPAGCTHTPTTEQNMRKLIDLAIAETNTAYDLSGVDTELNLVHAYRTEGYKEDSFSGALTHLRGSADGNMDEVHEKREQYKADIVALIIGARGSCGIGYLGPSKSFMFSATNYGCATGYFSFGHEIGHNLGCNHDKGASNACSSSNYNYGWRDPKARFRSILAYSCRSGQCDNNAGGGCTRVQRFSNPYFEYNNEIIGTELNNNARRINDVKATVANYFVRPTEPRTTSAPTPATNAPTPTPTPAPTPLPSIHNTRCRGNTPCDVCGGNCHAKDHRCKPGLYCFVRHGHEPVPGCSGTPKRYRDYCVAL